MEFVQYYPTATGKHGRRIILYEQLLLEPAVRLRNKKGGDLLEALGIADPSALTRDRLAQLIYQAMAAAQQPDQAVFMDTADLSEERAGRLAALLPARWWKGEKVFSITPTAHFCMGGVVTRPDGETALKGVFAIGEVAAGVHGANRLGGNALAEIFTMGAVGGEAAARRARETPAAAVPSSEFNKEYARLADTHAGPGPRVKQLTTDLKTLMWTRVGVIRHPQHLRQALDQLDQPPLRAAVSSPMDLIRYLEFENMRCVAKLVCRAALERTESRGSHYRSDFPEEDNRRWLKNIVLRKTSGGPSLEKVPVRLDRVRIEDDAGQ
jgi:succinate dehydrogenase/fumarate reductase flavoprotein subunit